MRSQTALYFAVDTGHTLCVEYLVGYGAKVDVIGPQGNTPLHVVLGQKNMSPLSEWTTYLNEVYLNVESLPYHTCHSFTVP